MRVMPLLNKLQLYMNPVILHSKTWGHLHHMQIAALILGYLETARQVRHDTIQKVDHEWERQFLEEARKRMISHSAAAR